jgi:hypothetical protein
MVFKKQPLSSRYANIEHASGGLLLMSHVVVTVQLIDDEGQVQSVKEMALDEIRLPEKEPENTLDKLEERAEGVGREVIRTVLTLEWEILVNSRT